MPSCIPDTYKFADVAVHITVLSTIQTEIRRQLIGIDYAEVKWWWMCVAPSTSIHRIHIKTSIIDLFDQVCARNGSVFLWMYHFSSGIKFFTLSMRHFTLRPYSVRYCLSCAKKFNSTGNYQDNVSFFERTAHPFIVAMRAYGWMCNGMLFDRY